MNKTYSPLTLFFFVVIFVLSIQKSNARIVATFQIKGTVKDLDGKPIGDATVFLQNLENKTIVKQLVTGVNGDFTIITVAGNYQLIISHIGYTQYRNDSLTLSAEMNMGTIQLQSLNKILDEVVIKSEKKQPFITVEGRKLVYNISKSINAQGSNALEALNFC